LNLYKSQTIFIIVPAIDHTGPVQGAMAMKKILSDNHEIFLLPLKESNKKLSIKNIITDFKYVASIVRDRENVLFVSYCFFPDLFSWALKKIFYPKKIAWISSIREIRIDNYGNTYGNFQGLLLSRIHNRISSSSDVLICMNYEMVKQFKLYDVNRFEIVGNFIDEDKFLPDKCRQYGNNKFIFVGAFSRRKAVLELAEAFINEFSKREDTCCLHYFGDGECKQSLQSFESDKIEIHDFSNELSKEYNSSSVFVLPSYSEGFSRALLEALYYGLICVVRDIPQFSILKDNKNVYFFKTNLELGAVLRVAFEASQFKTDFSIAIPYQLRMEYVKNNTLDIVDDLMVIDNDLI